MTPVVDSVLNVALEITTVNVAIPPCYPRPMPDLDTRAVGSFWPDNPGNDFVVCEHDNNPARIGPFWMDYHGRKRRATRDFFN